MVMKTGATVQQRSIEDMERMMSASETEQPEEEKPEVVEPALAPAQKVGYGRAGQRLKARIATVMALMIKETNEETRKELERRKQQMEQKLTLHQQKKANKANPNPNNARPHKKLQMLTQRIVLLTQKIEDEADPAKKTDLEKRKAGVEGKLRAWKEKKANNQNKNNVAFPGITKKLANVEQQLNKVTEDGKRAKLLQRKQNLLDKLAAKKASNDKKEEREDTTDEDVSMHLEVEEQQDISAPVVVTKKDAETETAVMEDTTTTPAPAPTSIVDPDPESLVGYPGIAKKLANINQKLKEVKKDEQRAKLELQKAGVLAKLAAKQAKRANKDNKQNNRLGEGLKKRISKIESMLNKQNLPEEEKNELYRRKAGLLIKMAEEQHNNSCSSDDMALDVDVDDDVDTLKDTVAVNNKQQQTNKGKPADGNKQRQNQKQRLIKMEKAARANNNQEALNRIALQQVYVAHYPDSAPQYVPVWAKGEEVIAKRAALRAQAIEAARNGSPVGWIAPDMYQRLPRDDWTLEDEMAVFHGGNKNNKRKKNPNTTDRVATEAVEDAFVALGLDHTNEDAFVAVDHTNETKDTEDNDKDTDHKTTTKEEEWTEVEKEDKVQDKGKAEATAPVPPPAKKPKNLRRALKAQMRESANAAKMQTIDGVVSGPPPAKKPKNLRRALKAQKRASADAAKMQKIDGVVSASETK